MDILGGKWGEICQSFPQFQRKNSSRPTTEGPSSHGGQACLFVQNLQCKDLAKSMRSSHNDGGFFVWVEYPWQ